MFDIGWTEILLIAVVAIIVVGPKDLPGMLRTIGQTVKKVRGMAGDFQRQFDDALKDAELDGVRDTLKDVRSLNPVNSLKDKLNPLKDTVKNIEDDINDGLDYNPDDLFDDDPGMVAEDPVKVDVEAALKREAEKNKFTGSDVMAKKTKTAAKKTKTATSAKKPATKKAPAKGKSAAAKAKPTKSPANKPASKSATAAKPAKSAKVGKTAARKSTAKKASKKNAV